MKAAGGFSVVVDGLIYSLQRAGGISRIYSEILPRMCALDPSFLPSLVTEGRIRQPLPSHPGIRHCPVPNIDPCLRPWRVWKPAAPAVRRFVREIRIATTKGRIWHSTYFSMPARWRGRVVATVYDMILEMFPGLFDQSAEACEQKRRAIEAADAVICISETTARDLQAFYNVCPSVLRVIPLGCSTIFREQLPPHAPVQPEQKPFFLYLGSRARYKNFHELLQAYARWPRQKDADLVVAGEPWTQEEKAQLSALGIGDAVRLLTGVDDPGLRELYARSLALVYPSRYEGFGLPLVEAMSCGCPVVASHIPSTLEVAGDCPIYFDLASSESFTAALETAFVEHRKQQRGEKAAALASRYSWDATARQTLQVYRELL